MTGMSAYLVHLEIQGLRMPRIACNLQGILNSDLPPPPPALGAALPARHSRDEFHHDMSPRHVM